MAGRTVRRHRRAGQFSRTVSEGLPGGADPVVSPATGIFRDALPDDACLDGRSYGELYVEHAPAARRLALSMVPHDVADDIVAEAFARVLAAIRAGRGPDHAFRGYLLTTVRHLAHDWLAARRRLTVIGDLDEEAGASGVSGGAEAQAEARAEARLIIRAFSRLPGRWRTVLWHLEVEGQAPADVAPMFGLSANGVSALAMRAREGLRQAYLQEHIGTNIPAACRAYAAELGAGTRGRLSPRRHAAMQEHLRHCPVCANLFTELSELNGKLRTILAPIALAGVSAAVRSGRHAALRAGLTAQWRSWRWHPVTAAAGTAAGLAVAGSMVFAVNITPVTGSPSHAAARAAAPPAATSGPVAGGHAPRRHDGGGGGGGGTLTGSGAPAGSGPGSAVPSGAPGSLAGATPPSPTTASTPPGGTASAGSGTSGVVTSLASTAGTTVTGLADTAGTMVTGLASTADGTVTGVTGTVSSTVNGVANAAGTAASAASTAAGTAASTAGSTADAVDTTVTGVTGTVGANL